MAKAVCNQPAAEIDASVVRKSLLHWYDRERRDLPWRPRPRKSGPRKSSHRKGEKANPYHVLVSEAMLQQTQVATVVSYFNRFIAAFPTIESLAAADEQRVLTLWQGLGYYRRARHLHAAAKLVVSRFDGQIPSTVDALLHLPGVGRYSAGAIASIAYDTPAPILDGNVARVLARLYSLDQPIDDTATKQHLWSLAESLVLNFRGRAGDFNQSLMELGALVCTPKQPHCLTCPLRDVCATRSDALPIKLNRAKPKPVTHTVIAVRRADRYLFEQRSHTGLWSNMWQLPTAESPIDPAAWVAERFNLTIAPPEVLDTFTHQTTHRTIEFRVLTTHATRGRLRPRTAQWRTLTNLDDLPLSNPQRRIIQTLTP